MSRRSVKLEKEGMELLEPQVGKDCYIAPGATIIGSVQISECCTVWPGAVIRGDGGSIKIGAHTSIQDNVSIHTDPQYPVTIGEYCSIGHNAVVHGCTVEDCCIIGMNSTILNGAVIGRGSIVGAGAVVKENMIVPPHSLVIGVPAKVVKSGNKEQEERCKMNALGYDTLREAYIKGTFKFYQSNKSKL